MIYKNQIKHLKAEKAVLATAHNQWIPELFFTFKDKKYLYMGMEYLPGGDLMNLFIKKDVLKEEEAKFYMAEMVLAIDAIH